MVSTANLHPYSADGSAIAAFEKLRRFCQREGIELVLSDIDRPNLQRVAEIVAFGEDDPTFAGFSQARRDAGGDARWGGAG